MADFADFQSYFLSLPSDPEEAFVVYHTDRMADMDANTTNESGWYYERKYVDCMAAFDEVYGLGVFAHLGDAPGADTNFGAYYHLFRRQGEKTVLKFQIEHARRTHAAPVGLVKFDETGRKAMRQLIEALRDELGKLDITEIKRAALFRSLNAFAHEVDQNLSRTESIFQFAVELARVARETGQEFKPVMDRVDRILDMVDRTQKWVESLPPWSKRKEIGSPQKQIEDQVPDRTSGGMDDDIPF